MDLHLTLPRTRAAALAAVFLLAGLAGCGGDDSSSSGDTTTTTSADSGDPGATDEYVIVAKDFSLTDLTVEAGEEFTLDNQGDSTHTATADDGSFDSDRIEPGQQSEPMTAPTTPGSYPFHCEIHSSMTGTLTVE